MTGHLMERYIVTRGWLAGAALAIVVAGCGGAGGRAGEEYRPPAGLERLTPIELSSDDIGLVRDFELDGSTVYLLDATGRVSVIERRGSTLDIAGHFSRRGSGPGELQQPTGLALAGGNIAVIDGIRLHFFSRTGEPLTMKWLNLPCTMMLPSVAAARAGFFVYGNCVRGGYMTDTMVAVLAWAADTTSFEIVIDVPRFTRDGSMGSMFGAPRLLTTGLTGRHAFGGGELNCIWMIEETESRPRATETCPAGAVPYSSEPPPGLERRASASRAAGMRVRWPDPLPAYHDRFVADDAVVLLRPFSPDSMVLQTAAPGAVDIAVAPIDGLVGCKASGCVWVIEEDAVPRLILLDRAGIEMRLRAAGEQ